MAQRWFPARRESAWMPSMFGNWNEFINRFMTPSFFEPAMMTGMAVPVDVCERGNEFLIRVACPGCRPQDIDVTVENDTVRIRGKFPEHEEAARGEQTGQKGEQCLIRELPTGRFERDITLPTAVNAQQARATFDNGILSLFLTKTAAAQGQRISISQAAGQPQGSR